MQTVTIGKKQGLVFPIMCNGVINIDYSDNIPDIDSDSDTATDVPYGIWGHVGSFSFDAIITPYDTNGSTVDIVDSKKTIPNNGYYSLRSYVGSGHEMVLFHSTKLKIYLVNSSYTNGSGYADTLNYNNPATYQIKIVLVTGTTTTTLISDSVIFPSTNQPLTYSTNYMTGGFDSEGRLVNTLIETLGGSAHGGSTTFTSGTNPASNLYNKGESLFIKSGFDFTNIGRITNLNAATVTLSGTPSSLNSQIIYREAPKEATYVDNTYHIGVSFDNNTKKLSILYEGRTIKTTTHSDKTTDFQLDAENLYLGANGTNAYANSSTIPSNLALSNKQFYGVFHEMCFSKGLISSYDNGALRPTYQNLLMFLNFEEVDM